ncbi:MAG: hypothetical protein WC314_17415 [Vulcanimicrobiota bacterium]
MIETDRETGRSYLRVPLPEKEALQSLLQAATPLLQMLSGLSTNDDVPRVSR